MNSHIRTLGLPRSITGYNKYGVLPSTMRYMLQNLFHYPVEFQDTLKSYHLLFWSPVHFASRIKNGTISHDGREFNIIYQNCTPESIKQCAQIMLSFRVPQSEYDMESYVLIRKGDTQS